MEEQSQSRMIRQICGEHTHVTNNGTETKERKLEGVYMAPVQWRIFLKIVFTIEKQWGHSPNDIIVQTTSQKGNRFHK